jgi:polyisoprenoid-binding protein YceI
MVTACVRVALLRISLVALLTMTLLPNGALGQAFLADNGHVEFLSNVPLHSFVGESEQLVGRVDLAERTVDFYVDLNTLDTGIGKRDKDMRKTLETDTYPFAEFFGTLLTEIDPETAGPQAVEVEGDFTVHGITRSIRVPGTITFDNGDMRVTAAWVLNLKDHDIEPPRLLIIKVDEEQAISFDILLKPE